MGDFDESLHPRDEAGKFTDGDGAAHDVAQVAAAVSAAFGADYSGKVWSKGGHERVYVVRYGKKDRGYIDVPATGTPDLSNLNLAGVSTETATTRLLAALEVQHVSQASAKAREAEKGGDHAKAQAAHEGAQQAHEKAAQVHPGDHATQAQHQAQAAQHGALAAQHGEHAEKGGEHGHGLGAWVAHQLEEAKEGVHEKGEQLREVEEKAIEADPFKAAEAVAGAGAKAAAGGGGALGKWVEKTAGGGEHGGGAHH